MHWAEAYVGEPYLEGEQDCGSFSVRVVAEQFGRRIRLPTARAQGLRGLSRQIVDLLDDYGEPVVIPCEGDAVLMVSRGELQHIGLYCEVRGEACVLHAVRNAGQVCLHPLRMLSTLGLVVQGFYRWR